MAQPEVTVVMMWNGWAWWQMLLMWIGMIAFWALVICAIWALVMAATRRPDQDRGDRSARHILDQRLAHGEIDIDEYRRRRDVIEPAAGPHLVDVGDRTGR